MLDLRETFTIDLIVAELKKDITEIATNMDLLQKNHKELIKMYEED